MKKSIRAILIAVVSLGVIAVIGTVALVMFIRPSPVDSSVKEACLHDSPESIMTKIIRAKAGSKGEWKTFSDTQDAAEQAGILIDPAQMQLSGDVWMVPFNQHEAGSGTHGYIGLLDCSTDSVEFSSTDSH